MKMIFTNKRRFGMNRFFAKNSVAAAACELCARKYLMVNQMFMIGVLGHEMVIDGSEGLHQYFLDHPDFVPDHIGPIRTEAQLLEFMRGGSKDVSRGT